MVRDAYKFAVPPLLLGLAGTLPVWPWPAVRWGGAVLAALGVFVLYFFRDPERAIPVDPDAVVSPADGRVTVVAEESYEGRPGWRISIFLSVFNVHVQRAPVAGTVAQLEYRPGRFLNAMRASASTENEQNVIRLATPRGEIFFKQIAGAIARRVMFWKSVGEDVGRGERVGMIRFGSRVDVWLPAEAEIVVRRGQNVAGGSSIVARWKCSDLKN
jgi:phosphatidylserine decarboxylase